MKHEVSIPSDLSATQGDMPCVRSSRFGKIQVPREQLISLPLGVAGFEAATTFVLVEISAGSKFRWLQALDFPELGFVVVEAQDVSPEFPVDQVRRGLEFCEIDDDEVVVALAICRVPAEPDELTVNLQAPIGIGLRSRRGAQVLLRETSMTMTMPLRWPVAPARDV